ncbi:PDDEXK nuclease domain-containing protein [Microlunatus elymi]|uniref:PDDEXK nuclease domain-containing protein n=1 Tax=Microlunatus elymi TaxID=2596828 RepID=UPI001D184243
MLERQGGALTEVGGDDFFIDLLFYHLKLHRYMVIELKAEKFRPEHLGQLAFYLTAVDNEMKSHVDGPTIGLLLCRGKNAVVAEYAMRDSTGPLGIADYQLAESLPTTCRRVFRPSSRSKESSKWAWSDNIGEVRRTRSGSGRCTRTARCRERRWRGSLRR